VARRRVLSGLSIPGGVAASALFLSFLGACFLLPVTLVRAQAADTNRPAASPPPAEAPPADPAPPQAFFKPNAVKMTPEVRERLAQLLQLPKEQLWQQLMEWPAFKEMSLQEQAEFVNRLAQMREHIRAQALKKAAELNIKVPPEKEEAFVNSYIQERMAIERKIWEETQVKRHELDEQLKANLKKQYLGDAAPSASGGSGSASNSSPGATNSPSPLAH